MANRVQQLLFLALTFVGLLYLTSFVASFGNGLAFFNVDPDMLYLGQGYLYFRDHLATFTDHPGTPTIALIGRLFHVLKEVVHFRGIDDFDSWLVQNFEGTVLGFRYLFAGLTYFSLSAMGWLIVRESKSFWLGLSFFFSLISFIPIQYSLFGIGAENVSIILMAVWLGALVAWLHRPFQVSLQFMLLFLAGVLVANKLSNLPLALASVASIYVWKKPDGRGSQMRFGIKVVFALLIGFVFATWPMHDSYARLFSWIGALASKKGSHGDGGNGFVDLGAWFSTMRGYLLGIPMFSILIAASLFTCWRKRNHDFKSQVGQILAASGVIGLLLFSKFSLQHYQIANIFLLAAGVSLTWRQRSDWLKFSLCLSLGLYLPTSAKWTAGDIVSRVDTVSAEKNFLKGHPAEVGRVWTWYFSEGFGVQWFNNYSERRLGVALERQAPPVFELQSDFKTIKDPLGNSFFLSEKCWDQLFLMKDLLPEFEKQNPTLVHQTIELSSPSRLLMVTSEHCQPGKP